MARAYYSAVFDSPADEVWAVIRDFGNYAWAGVEGETVIEEGKTGDRVGAVRRVTTSDRMIRQQLLAYSDPDRSYRYRFCGTIPFPVQNYVATIRIHPIVESGNAFVEWWATFDCAPDELDRWTRYFEQGGFAVWLGALRKYLAHGALTKLRPDGAE